MAIELATARLHFYTEQFWEGTVGSMVAQLDTKGFGLRAKGFVPSGQYLRNSTRPTEVGEYVLVWRFKNYRQARYYGGALVHPFAVNGEALLDRYLRGIGRSSADTTSAHILNADTLLVNSATGEGSTLPKPASMTFALHLPAAVMLNIWSDDGRVIRRLPQLETDVGTHSVDWDGLDYLRRPAPPGRYRFRLEVNGNWVGDREIIVTR